MKLYIAKAARLLLPASLACSTALGLGGQELLLHPDVMPLRTAGWKLVRAAHIKLHPACEVCGITTGRIDVHHIVPFAVDPSLELVESNLMTLCREHHLVWAHAGSWRRYDSKIVEAVIWWRTRRLTNPPIVRAIG